MKRRLVAAGDAHAGFGEGADPHAGAAPVHGRAPTWRRIWRRVSCQRSVGEGGHELEEALHPSGQLGVADRPGRGDVGAQDAGEGSGADALVSPVEPGPGVSDELTPLATRVLVGDHSRPVDVAPADVESVELEAAGTAVGGHRGSSSRGGKRSGSRKLSRVHDQNSSTPMPRGGGAAPVARSGWDGAATATR